MARRGLIFFVLDLHSIRCASCDADLIYRSEPPAVCPYCGGCPVDLGPVLASMKEFWDAFYIETTRILLTWGDELNRLAAKLSEKEK